jgi:hypothetical protein
MEELMGFQELLFILAVLVTTEVRQYFNCFSIACPHTNVPVKFGAIMEQKMLVLPGGCCSILLPLQNQF